MPRRDALSEKKRERLMQENEQLQKLMMQARSSVRRSSLKEQDSPEPEEASVENEADLHVSTSDETPRVEPVSNQHNGSADGNFRKPVTLTENELFQTPIAPRNQPYDKQPITEKQLFPEPNAEEATPHPQRNRTIRVILPEQNVAANVAPVTNRQLEPQPAPAPDVVESRVILQEPIAIEEENVSAEFELQQTRGSSKKGPYLLLLLVALLAGFGGYYWYSTRSTVTKQNRPATTAATKEQTPPAVVNKPAPETPATNSAPATPQPANEKPLSDELNDFDNVTIFEKPAPAKTAIPETKKQPAPQATPTGSLGKYKVISKAYFHNEPVESTRRKAFIIHWNNAVLTPIEEKDGFVYIVFTNHLGQTSKGWLRKADLKRID